MKAAKCIEEQNERLDRSKVSMLYNFSNGQSYIQASRLAGKSHGRKES